jgi:hypothetical protein
MAIPNLSIIIVRLDLSTFEIRFQTQEKLTGINRACKGSSRITKSMPPQSLSIRLRDTLPSGYSHTRPKLREFGRLYGTQMVLPLGYGNACDETRHLAISGDSLNIWWCPLRDLAHLLAFGAGPKNHHLIERNHKHLVGKEGRYRNLLGIQAFLKPSEDGQVGEAGKAKFTWVESLLIVTCTRIESRHKRCFPRLFLQLRHNVLVTDVASQEFRLSNRPTQIFSLNYEGGCM